MISLSQIHRNVRQKLTDAGLAQADLDARILVSGILNLDDLDLITRGDMRISEQQNDLIENALLKRLSGVPVYRILGWREFYGLRFELSEATLEPRPDTEILVDVMIPYVKTTMAKHGQCRILDLGTGTGAIALSILVNCEGATAIGVDQSRAALTVAQSNADQLGLGNRFSTLQSNWLDDVEGQFDLVVSNPPYIRSDVIDKLDVDVKKFDPILALDGGASGLDAYEMIASQIRSYLSPNAMIGLEIGFDQNDSVRNIFKHHGFECVSEHKDFGGNDRVIVCSL